MSQGKKAKKTKAARARDRPVAKKEKPLEQKFKQICKKISKMGGKKLLLQNFPYLMCGYFGNKLAYLYRITEETELFQRLIAVFEKMNRVFSNPLLSLHTRDLLAGVFLGTALRVAVYMKGKNAKKYRHGEEYGSARWGNRKILSHIWTMFLKITLFLPKQNI